MRAWVAIHARPWTQSPARQHGGRVRVGVSRLLHLDRLCARRGTVRRVAHDARLRGDRRRARRHLEEREHGERPDTRSSTPRPCSTSPTTQVEITPSYLAAGGRDRRDGLGGRHQQRPPVPVQVDHPRQVLPLLNPQLVGPGDHDDAMNRPRKEHRESRRPDSGTITIIAAALLTALMGMAALAVDLGFLYTRSRMMYAVADSAVGGRDEGPDGREVQHARSPPTSTTSRGSTAGYTITVPTPTATIRCTVTVAGDLSALLRQDARVPVEEADRAGDRARRTLARPPILALGSGCGGGRERSMDRVP